MEQQTIDSNFKSKFNKKQVTEFYHHNIGSDAAYHVLETQRVSEDVKPKQQNPFCPQNGGSKNIEVDSSDGSVNVENINQSTNTIDLPLIKNQDVGSFQAEYTFFLFVNPTSGGNLAEDFIKIQAERLNFNLKNVREKNDEVKVELYIYDLKNLANKIRGISLLKHMQDKGVKNIRVIVGGGDGTVMWVIQEMLARQCDLANTPIGIVPFGTGNDFARVLGWGGSVPSEFIGKNLNGMKEMIKKWIQAKVAPFDIWEISIKTNEEGSFKRIEKENGKAVKKELKDEKGQVLKAMKKPMSNYFSIGVDARIGLGFDKNRTTSQLGNKCVYCWEGFKKTFLRTKNISQVLDSLEELHEEDVKKNRISEIDISIEDQYTNNEVIFNTRSASTGLTIEQIQQLRDSQQEKIKEKEKNNFLKGNPACLLMLNINSYAGGTNKIWTSSKGQVGLEKFNKIKVDDQFVNQDFGDGQIEFVSFTSAISLANERFFSGQASRVAQGKGPFLLKFRKVDGQNKQEPIISYFQIDGEYYQIDSPLSIKIKLNKKLPNGKIQVLVNTLGNSY